MHYGDHDEIANAFGQSGVTAIYVDETEPEMEFPARKVVCIDTAMCETALTPDAAEELIRRLTMAISEARNGETPLIAQRHTLGARAYNCLGQAHVRTVEAAARMTDAELLSLHNFGAGSLERVRAVVGYAEDA